MPIIDKTFESNKYTAVYLVEEEHDGMRLDQYLQTYLASWSREQVKKKISQGDISIKDRPGKHRASTKIYTRDIITLITNKTEHEDEYWNGELLELQTEPEILFEDEDLIIISKPPYMSTHPTGKHLFNCATVFFESKYKKTCHSIHRLDRETSGALMLAKNPKCAQVMTEGFEKDLVRKCYFFIAYNREWNGEYSFEDNHRLGASEEGLKRIYINHFPKESTDGKSARTLFEVVHVEGDYVLGLAFPITGRQHQIRVHAMINGLPLVGDKLYLGNFKMFQRFKDNIATKEDHDLMEISRHALHAIALRAPYKGEEKIFSSKIPNDLKKWISSKMTIDLVELQERLESKIQDYFNKDKR
ncbi:RluA family pseudouridine synthase [Halobacteriovorax sp.]|uniref:RluA family pseudouridine synthase n=1 Tax=Halobacteriovorax sp. TaxID=2020862 RepID=UPI0035684D6D